MILNFVAETFSRAAALILNAGMGSVERLAPLRHSRSWAKPQVDTIISLGGDPADDASRAFRAAEALHRRGEPYVVSRGTNVSRWAGLASR